MWAPAGARLWRGATTTRGAARGSPGPVPPALARYCSCPPPRARRARPRAVDQGGEATPHRLLTRLPPYLLRVPGAWDVVGMHKPCAPLPLANHLQERQISTTGERRRRRGATPPPHYRE